MSSAAPPAGGSEPPAEPPGPSDGRMVVAPISGVVRSLRQVPDPVFAEEMVGPGLAVEPDGGHVLQVLAPVAGVVHKAQPHAVVITPGSDTGTDTGSGVLVHLGLDTVRLEGAGFTLHVRTGDRVHTGTHVLDWDPGPARAAGLGLISPVVLLGVPRTRMRELARPGTPVRAGQNLLFWSQA